MDMADFARGANVSNIAELTDRRLILDERRMCELREMAYETAKEMLSMFSLGMGAYEALSLAADMLTLPESALTDGVLADFASLLKRECDAVSALDRAAMCSFLCEQLCSLGAPIKERDFLPVDDAPETFTYVKNVFSDEAYDVFAQDFKDPRVTYATSLKDAVSLVSSGKITYCILPIEERGARLSTVAELLFKSELKIDAIIPVLGLDGLADVKYALVSRSFLIPEILPDDDRYLEIRIPADSDMPLSELLSVARYYGIEVHRLNTLVFDTDDGLKTYYIAVLRTDGKDFVPMLTYLTVYTNEFTPIGVYKNLE